MYCLIHTCVFLREPVGRWSFLIFGSEKEWYSTYIDSPGGEWDKVAELMMVEFGEIGNPDFRVSSPLSPGTLESEGGGKLSIHFCADGDMGETLRKIISVIQLSIYGGVSYLCEKYSICQTSTVRPALAEKSDPLFASENFWTMAPGLSSEILAQENVMQKCKEPVARIPQPD